MFWFNQHVFTPAHIYEDVALWHVINSMLVKLITMLRIGIILHHRDQFLDHRIHPDQVVSGVEHLTEGMRESHKHFVYCSRNLGLF